MDIVAHPSYSASKGTPDNQAGPRRDQYQLGLFDTTAICCVPRIEDWVAAKGIGQGAKFNIVAGIRVPWNIVEARYKGVRDWCGNDDAASLAPLPLDKLLKYDALCLI